MDKRQCGVVSYKDFIVALGPDKVSGPTPFDQKVNREMDRLRALVLSAKADDSDDGAGTPSPVR